MKYTTLGKTEMEVSTLCLGSMTWGTQNTEHEGHEQMDYAVEQGINFIDTAELYPTTPLSAETQGRTEEIIGTWFQKSGLRDKVILATKVAGKGPKWIQNGKSISAEKIRVSLEASLKRLKSDYVDLYQLHWPNRNSYHFRQTWDYDPTHQKYENTQQHIIEVLSELQKHIDAGKIRHIGLSNESCWGTSQFLMAAESNNLPRVVSIQNEYSLLHRIFDLDLAELSHNENVGLLAFSPLACGLLSGKYQNEIPDGSRMSMNADLSGRYNQQSKAALAKYFSIANKFNLDPAQMALAFCLTKPFMTSAIIGATTMNQLRKNIAAVDLELSEEVLEEISQVYREYPLTM